MISSTFRTNITGDSYKELLQKAQEEIATLLGLGDPEEALSRARCEMIVTTEDDLGSDFNYRAEVIARIK